MIVQIEQGALADEQVQDIIEFAKKTKDGIQFVEQDFEAKRKIIERFDTRATLVVENDQKIIYSPMYIGQKTITN